MYCLQNEFPFNDNSQLSTYTNSALFEHAFSVKSRVAIAGLSRNSPASDARLSPVRPATCTQQTRNSPATAARVHRGRRVIFLLIYSHSQSTKHCWVHVMCAVTINMKLILWYYFTNFLRYNKHSCIILNVISPASGCTCLRWQSSYIYMF